jgi:hypothetical protein
VDDYLNRAADAGFADITWRELTGDERLVEEVPVASKYLGRPLLLLISALRRDA